MTKRLRTTVWAACLAACWGGGTMKVLAQADALVLTNGSGTSAAWLDLPTDIPGQNDATRVLPTPGGSDGYSGTPATQAQHIRTNGDGSIIFFVVDGVVYDGDGYQIADATGSNCTQCMQPGVMEFLSVPVPGTCGLYYLFAATAKNTTTEGHVNVSLLDMSADREPPLPGQPACSARKGLLLSLDGTDLTDLYPQFDPWFTQAFFSGPAYVKRLNIDASGKSSSPIIRVVAGATQNDPSFLFVIMTTTIHPYKIMGSGVFPVNAILPSQAFPSGLSYYPLSYSLNSPLTQKEYYRDADARRLANGQIRVAITGGQGFAEWPEDGVDNFITLKFDGVSGAVVPGSIDSYEISTTPLGVNCNTVVGSPGGLAGCAIAADGNKVYLTAEAYSTCSNWIPTFGYLDLTSGQFIDLSANVGLTGEYVRSRIYRNIVGGTGEEILYIPGNTGVGVVTGLATSTPAFVPDAFDDDRAPVLVSGITQSYYRPRFLNPSVSGDQHLSAASKVECCGYFETVPGAVVEGYTQQQGTTSTWNGIDNTVQTGSATVAFTCDVVVRAGATLIVSNMNWKFDQAARLIVEQGGFLRMTNCTLTGMTCEQTRWPGIQVHGLPTSTQQGFGQYMVPIDQGMVELTNCNVSEATIGILTGSADVTALGVLYNIASDQGGAVVIANGCTFRNCVTSVDMRKYPDFVPQGQPLPLNRSRFNGTTFVVDEPSFYAPFAFKRLVRLDRVSGILFRKCHFQNLVNDAEYTTLGSAAIGYGIESYESQFQVLPSCSILLNAGEECPTANLVPSTFTGLDHGIHAIGGPNALRNFTVDAARFTDNICGVYVNGVIGFVAKRNTFLIGNRNVPLTNLNELTWTGRHRGLYSFKGSRFTVMDNTLLQSGINLTEGIVIGFSGEEDEIVFRNSSSNLEQAYTGEGQCADDVETATQGLWFKCNTNQNNRTNFRSRIVPGVLAADLQTIRTNQGSIFPIMVPADNEFDQTVGLLDFVNDGCDYNAISYWWADPLVPYKPIYTVCVAEDNDVNGVPIIRNPGNCLTRTRKREFVPDTKEELLAQAEAEKLAYADQRYLYEQLMDGGNTDEVLLEISSAWPQEAWDLRAYLLSKSPFLSVQVLQEAVNKPYFPMAMKAEVCIANPDATKKDGFLKWLQYDALFPMPEQLIASIEASWDQKTYRTSLENALAMHRSELVQSLNQVTEILTGDTVYDPTDSLQAVLQVLRSPGARYAEALLLMQQGQLSEAHAVVSDIPTEHELRPKEMDERGRMLQVIDLMQAVKASNRSEAELTVAEQNTLAALVEGQLDRPSVWAQNLLCWFYERCTAPPSGGDETPKSAKPQRRPLAAANMPMLAVQPNPAVSWAEVLWDQESFKAVAIRVQDMTGKTLLSLPVLSNSERFLLDTRTLSPGVYQLLLEEHNGSLLMGRMVKQ